MISERYFIELSYDGSEYSGWQRQPNAMTIQEEIESALSMLYGAEVSIMGCGRTDAGVHAAQYFCHCDLIEDRYTVAEACYKLNCILPNAIALKQIIKVESDAHTRFDATERSYYYDIHINKNPFILKHSYRFVQAEKIDNSLLNESAALIKTYEDFYPFCKSHADVDTFKCQIKRSEWEKTEMGYRFHITANRFLRGMVRMIVGMCLNVSTGKLKLSDVKIALEKQTRLDMAWSVPAEGLFLSEIKYPYI